MVFTLPIISWDRINEPMSLKPADNRPVITIYPNEQQIRYLLQKPNFIVKVKVSGTKNYDIEDGIWGEFKFAPDNSVLIILRTFWLGVSKQLGMVTILEEDMYNLPQHIKEFYANKQGMFN